MPRRPPRPPSRHPCWPASRSRSEPRDPAFSGTDPVSWRGGRRPAPVAWLLALALALAVASPGPAATPASPGLPRIALLSIGTDPSQPPTPQWQAFFEGLRALGWIEGRNLLVERR